MISRKWVGVIAAACSILALLVAGAVASYGSNSDDGLANVSVKEQHSGSIEQPTALTWLIDAVESFTNAVSTHSRAGYGQMASYGLVPYGYSLDNFHLTCQNVVNDYDRHSCLRLCPGFDVSYQACVRDWLPLASARDKRLNGRYPYYDDGRDDARWDKTLTAKRNNYVAKKLGKVRNVSKDLSALREGEAGWTDPTNLEGMPSVSYLPAAAELHSSVGDGDILNRLLVMKRDGIYRAVLFTSAREDDIGAQYPMQPGPPSHGSIRIHYVTKAGMFP
jgi:hypothetical protein